MNPSPYVACLQGIDEVQAVIDRPAGIIWLQPRRSAPPILVESGRVLVKSNHLGYWLASPAPVGPDRDAVEEVFDPSLGGFIINALLNESAAALLPVAAKVGPAPTPAGLSGNSFEVIVDRDRYLVEAGGGGEVPYQQRQ